MARIDFSYYCNCFSGLNGWVIGRGPSTFPYEDLAYVDGPVFFLNDAVALENKLSDTHTSFFFAHDSSMAVWLSNINSIAVLPIEFPCTGRRSPKSNLLAGPNDPLLDTVSRVILYTCDNNNGPNSILTRPREDIATLGCLHIQSGTIHSLLHFAWYTGCVTLKLIGCDGLPGIGYDSRLANVSRSTSRSALRIRTYQDYMLRKLMVSVVYLGTPEHTLVCSIELNVDLMQASELHTRLIEIRSLTAGAPGCRTSSFESYPVLNKSIFESTWTSVASFTEYFTRPDINKILVECQIDPLSSTHCYLVSQE